MMKYSVLLVLDEAHEQFLEPVRLVAQADNLDAAIGELREQVIEIDVRSLVDFELGVLAQSRFEAVELRRNTQRLRQA